MGEVKLTENDIIVFYEDENVSYKSIVQEIDDESLLINVPAGYGKYYYLEEDIEYNINHYTDNSYYSFKSKLIGKEKDIEKNIPLYRIEVPYDVVKIQRRDFVRVSLVDYISYKLPSGEGSDKWREGLLLDLSGGGIRFSTREKLEENTIYIFKLSLGNEEIIAEGKIVRGGEKALNGNIYGVEFYKLKEASREKIIRAVFHKMRIHRKNE